MDENGGVPLRLCCLKDEDFCGLFDPKCSDVQFEHVKGGRIPLCSNQLLKNDQLLGLCGILNPVVSDGGWESDVNLRISGSVEESRFTVKNHTIRGCVGKTLGLDDQGRGARVADRSYMDCHGQKAGISTGEILLDWIFGSRDGELG